MKPPYRRLSLTRRESSNALRAFALSAQAAGFTPKEPIPDAIEKRHRDPSAGSEHKLQVSVIYWWRKNHDRYGLPEFALFAIPNGAHIDPIHASRLKSEGMRPGILDLALDVPRGKYHGWRAEMKYGKNKESNAQLFVGMFLRAQGYYAGTFWTADDCIDSIQDYLEGRL